MENPDINIEKLAEQYPEATRELLELTEALNSKQLQREGQKSFLTYINHMWPDFVEGRQQSVSMEKSSLVLWSNSFGAITV